MAQQVGGDEPPPRFSVQRWAAIRECLVRSTVPVGGGRSPCSFGRNMRPTREPDIEGEVTFLATADGGRSTPALSGYRPNHLVLPDYLTSGHHEYKDKDQVLPGESAVTDIWFLTPGQYPRSMQVGAVIRVQEASRLVGHAKVLKIYNKVLQG